MIVLYENIPINLRAGKSEITGVAIHPIQMKSENAKKRLFIHTVFRQLREVGESRVVLFINGPSFPKNTVARLRRVVRVPRMMFWAFMMEGIETKNMVRTFVKQGKGQLLLSKQSEPPTEEEIKEALAQLKDLPKFLPFFVFIAVPVPGVTEGYVLLAVTLEKYLGQKFSLLPSHFRQVFEKKKEATEEPPEEPGA